MPEKEVGRVSHYFSKISVAAVDLTDTLAVGDKIHIKGHTTDFEQIVESMQIEHENVVKATKGQSVGIKVKDHVREHDTVYKVTE